MLSMGGRDAHPTAGETPALQKSMSILLTAAFSYLLGSIPFGFILVRIFRGQDVRLTGSGNIGATNVARSSPTLGLLTLLLDAAQGFRAVTVAVVDAFQRSRVDRCQPYYPEHLWTPLPTIVAIRRHRRLFAIIGHMFPGLAKVSRRQRSGDRVRRSFAMLAPKATLGRSRSVCRGARMFQATSHSVQCCRCTLSRSCHGCLHDYARRVPRFWA